jgi:cytochrome P450
MLADPDFIPFQPRPGSNAKAVFRSMVQTFPAELYAAPVIKRYRRGFTDAMVLTDPEAIHQLLVEQPDKFVRDQFARRLLTPLLGDRSLLMAEGGEWRWQRRAAAPAFRHESLMALVPTMTAAAERQISRWRGAPSDRTIDVDEDMTRITFEIITETLLGRPNALDFGAFGQTLMDYAMSLKPRALLAFFRLPTWLPFPGRARSVRGAEQMLALIRQSMNIRKDQGAEGAPSSLFELLLNAQDPESGRRADDEDFVRNVATFLNAGHETTAVALTWSLWLLSKDQESQDRVAAEAEAVMGQGPGEAAHIDKLVFTRQVIQEAMRLYPPAPALARRPREAMSFAGQEVTPGTQITVAIYPLHRNRGLWEQPDAFAPERFTPEQVKARPRHAYMPFGAGPRICIGMQFSLMEASIVLAQLVRAYRFAPLEGYRPETVGHVTIRPHAGMPLYVTPRGGRRRRAPAEERESAAA